MPEFLEQPGKSRIGKSPPGGPGKLPKSPFSRNTDQVGERHFVRKADYTGQVLEARSSFVLSQARFPMEAFVQHQETTRDI
jgi:hypothetical protein